MDTTLDTIVEFVRSTSVDDIPDPVLERARDILVDSLGCAVGGQDSPASKVAEDLVGAANSDERGVVIGRTRGAPAELAAFWNSAMIRYLDFNDSGSSGGHPSDMIGAHIALSSMARASGRDLLAAVVIGHEVYNRITDRLLYEDRRLDHGYPTALGVAAAGAHLLKLTPEQTRHAVSFAATSSLSTRAVRAGQLSHMKGFATALGAKEAVFYLQLAQAGLTAPVEPFEGRHGVVELMTSTAGPVGLDAFDSWTMLGCKLKYWPAAYNTQPAIWAALDLRKKLSVADLATVKLGVNRRAWHESGSESAKWDPQTRETADHSIPYLFARAFIDGVIDEASFDLDKVRSADVREVMAKVEVVLDPEMEAARPKLVLGCRAEAVDATGAHHEVYVDGIAGDADRPLSRDQIAEKFARLTTPALGDGAEAAFNASWNTLESNDFQSVLAAFRP